MQLVIHFTIIFYRLSFYIYFFLNFVKLMPSILQALAWWESLELATQLFHGAEGEEDEVVGGAGASIMVEAMAKEVKKKPKQNRHTCT